MSLRLQARITPIGVAQGWKSGANQRTQRRAAEGDPVAARAEGGRRDALPRHAQAVHALKRRQLRIAHQGQGQGQSRVKNMAWDRG